MWITDEIKWEEFQDRKEVTNNKQGLSVYMPLILACVAGLFIWSRLSGR